MKEVEVEVEVEAAVAVAVVRNRNKSPVSSRPYAYIEESLDRNIEPNYIRLEKT
jgi:hypothetical protein